MDPESPPPPVLLEPESGAAFADRVRFKILWYRELAENERFAILLASVDGPGIFEWRPSAQDILSGGGKIDPLADGVRFEVNGGMGNLPLGDALWKVAVFEDGAEGMTQVTPWSGERPIMRK
jgi:hypothetical protein